MELASTFGVNPEQLLNKQKFNLAWKLWFYRIMLHISQAAKMSNLNFCIYDTKITYYKYMKHAIF